MPAAATAYLECTPAAVPDPTYAKRLETRVLGAGNKVRPHTFQVGTIHFK